MKANPPDQTPAGRTPTAPQAGGLLVPLAAMIAGAVALGVSPVFVRIAEVGPIASAFWRIALAIPLLYAWRSVGRRRTGRAGGVRRHDGAGRAVVLAGALFAGDLIFWHLSIHRTSIANATFLATFAAIWVAVAAAVLLAEPIERRTAAALVLCLTGAALMIGWSVAAGDGHVAGDLYGLITSVFLGGYIVAVRRARDSLGAADIMLRSALVTAAILLPVALIAEARLLPATAAGWGALIFLAVVTQALGQGLVAIALGALTASFSAMVIFIEAIAAALAAWIFLSEPMGAWQILGAGLILGGIWIARPRPGPGDRNVAPNGRFPVDAGPPSGSWRGR